jgi:RHS repeat-associated protein
MAVLAMSVSSIRAAGALCAASLNYDAAGNTQSYSNVAFVYNQRGRMSVATVGSTTTDYFYSALGQMIKKTVGSTTTLLVYDEAGHPAGLGTFVYNLRFPGQYYQAETGLNYNYFRDYDPQTGRYFESDPLGLAGGISTYGYGLQNPLQFNDPFGLEPPEPPGPR